MLIHPWDATLGPSGWKTWLTQGHDFGQLVVNAGTDQPPMVIPRHFSPDLTPPSSSPAAPRAL